MNLLLTVLFIILLHYVLISITIHLFSGLIMDIKRLIFVLNCDNDILLKIYTDEFIS